MKRAFLDAGHGGKDSGAVGNNLKEKDINLSVVLKVGEILKRHNVEVKYSRATDVFVELSERAKIANEWGADVFVSIHCNSFNSNVYGVETFCYDYKYTGARTLATKILSNIVVASLCNKSRGVKEANYAVLRETKMAATLVEMAFIDNTLDAVILNSKQNELAIAIAKGILETLNIAYIEPVKSQPQPPIEDNTFYRVVAGSYKDRTNANVLVNRLKALGIDAFIDIFKK